MPLWNRGANKAPRHPIIARLAELDSRLAEDLQRAWDAGGDVDRARLIHCTGLALANDSYLMQWRAELQSSGAGAEVHPSGLRDLPERRAAHDLLRGSVRLGAVVSDRRNNPVTASGDFGVSLDSLRTSMLVVAPPGSGKTYSVARPIVEALSLAALAQKASVIVLDVKGDDFDFPDWFDLTINPLNQEGSSVGLSLFGGATESDEAADRLSSALLPTNVSGDKAYFMDASRNALYAALAPFKAAKQRWPRIDELLGMLTGRQAVTDGVRASINKAKSSGRHSKDETNELLALLDLRAQQLKARTDPAASLVERLSLLNRPMLKRLFDAPVVFSMTSINKPVRVRIVLPEAQFPDASRIIARLVVSQFSQVCMSPCVNRTVFKGLVIEEAGRYIDDYVARSIQRVRSNNAGLVLLTQSLGDFPIDLKRTIVGSVGCKAVFGGIDPEDASVFSEMFGEDTYVEPSFTTGRSESSMLQFERQPPERVTRSNSMTLRPVTRARWSSSDLMTGLPQGRMVISLASSRGERVGPILVDTRNGAGQIKQ